MNSTTQLRNPITNPIKANGTNNGPINNQTGKRLIQAAATLIFTSLVLKGIKSENIKAPQVALDFLLPSNNQNDVSRQLRGTAQSSTETANNHCLESSLVRLGVTSMYPDTSGCTGVMIQEKDSNNETNTAAITNKQCFTMLLDTSIEPQLITVSNGQT
jgi:hypothetical protein